MTTWKYWFATLLLGATALIGGAAVPAAAQDAVSTEQLNNADKDAKNWMIYRGSYDNYNYSGLKQVNDKNIKNLEVAWMHTPGRSTKGLQSEPMAVDGIVYYSGSYSRVFALDGQTGNVLWAFLPELD